MSFSRWREGKSELEPQGGRVGPDTGPRKKTYLRSTDDLQNTQDDRRLQPRGWATTLELDRPARRGR